MKRFYLSVLLILIAWGYSNAQLRKGDVILNLSGNYDENFTNSGVSISSLSGKTKTLNAGVSMGFVTSKSLVLGFGLEYGHIRNVQNYSFLNPGAFLLYETQDIKSNIVAPMVYAKYYKKVMSRIYVGLGLEGNYAFVNSDNGSDIVTVPFINSSGVTSAVQSTLSSSRESASYEAFNAMLRPEVDCFLTKTLGLSLKVGGARFTSYSFNEHEWHISLNPSSWEYGLFWRFGKK